MKTTVYKTVWKISTQSKVLNLNTHREAMERSSMEMGVDNARGFLLSA